MNKIAVVGDSILDEYYQVDAEKVSPEFPIPILSSEFSSPQKQLPGGAANVCYQFDNFDKSISYFGFVDLESLSIFEDYLPTDNCVLINGNIPRKKRHYQDCFPICRIDIESPNYNLDQNKLNLYQRKVCENLSNNNFDIVIFSDYGKGLFHEFDIQNYFNSVGDALKIVDPKYGPASKWIGCDVIKPNYKEAKEISGKSFWKDQVVYFKQETKAKIIIITQGGNGIFGMINDEFFEFEPRKKTIPVSVIGAGDCFVSLLAIGLSDNLGIKESIENAFYGSSLYVKNKHNQPIHPADLISDKIIKNPKVLSKRNFTLCFTNGCFDFGLTPAHVELLRQAKQKKEKLVVALNSDLSVKRLKGEDRPFFNFDERANILSGLEFVDYIIKFEEDTPINVINDVRPDLIIKGGDYSQEDVVGYGQFPVEIFNFMDTYSTTDKIRIASKKI
jgi:D-beta-D-heptose 7-phosphate kinase/D-beta-D-heptose 1-phosphate adenosyltransferase